MCLFLEVEMKKINCSAAVNNTVLRKVIRWLASLEKWRQITPMQSPRSTGFSLIFKSKIYVFGGYTSDKKRSKTIEIYDPFKNYW
jgi:N-acetylneuraminic acid mutarotase